MLHDDAKDRGQSPTDPAEGAPDLEDTAGIPGAIHSASPEIEEEVAESQIGVGGGGTGDEA